MDATTACSCGRLKYNVVFACSGASDVGCISDQAARLLSRNRTAAMSCTAGVAARVADLLDRARAAEKIAVIDGCDKKCADTVMRGAGFTGYAHIQLGDLGFEKSKTPPTQERVQAAADAATSALKQIS